jgi:putative methylase
MSTRRGLERRLADLATFDDPRVDLEQYPTPADVAAHVLHDADLRGDLEGSVVDLGAGTGVLALGAALRSPGRVIGVERDPDAIALARENERRIDAPVQVSWLLADVPRNPLCAGDATVVMNPPFGAQRGNRGADRAFLSAASRIARVSYSIHNAGSESFVESFVADAGGEVTHAFEARLDLDRQFPFHTSDREKITVEVFRIEW